MDSVLDGGRGGYRDVYSEQLNANLPSYTGAIMEETSLGSQLALALAAAVFTQIANILYQLWTSKHTQAKDAGHLAIRMAGLLEQFALTCAEQIDENRAYEDTAGVVGRPTSTLPELASYPDDPTWRSMDRKLLGRAITLRSEILTSTSSMRGMEELDPDGVHERLIVEAGICGYRAWMLATELRNRYGYPLINSDDYTWDPIRVLDKVHSEGIEARKKTRENAARIKREEEERKKKGQINRPGPNSEATRA